MPSRVTSLQGRCQKPGPQPSCRLRGGPVLKPSAAPRPTAQVLATMGLDPGLHPALHGWGSSPTPSPAPTHGPGLATVAELPPTPTLPLPPSAPEWNRIDPRRREELDRKAEDGEFW